jgi:hypothetical protein
MALSRTLAALFGFVAFSHAYPVQETFEISPVQIEDLFRYGVESYLSSLPSSGIQELSRNVEVSAAPQACEDVFLIFARGTFEPASTNNLGIMVGSQFNAALSSALGSKFGSAGVDYNNGVGGYLSGGDAAGSTTMAQMINSKVSQCPSTKIIASGYR